MGRENNKDWFLSGWLSFCRLWWVEFYRHQISICQKLFLDKNLTFGIVW